MSKEIKKITADEVYPVSMRRLGDRPNSSSAQGRGGMSSAELKGFMDKYPELVKERLNELIDMCNADSKDGIAKAIKTPVIDPETGNEFSLYDWFAYAKIYLKGDGIETIEEATTGRVQKVIYDTTFGATVKNDAAIKYVDSTDGTIKTQNFPLLSMLPILPDKYISIVANAGANAIYIKVDDTALAQDYIKIDKTLNNVMPLWYDGKISWYKLTSAANGESVAYRDGAGNSSFNKVKVNEISSIDGRYSLNIPLINFSVKDTDMVVTKTVNDTGTLPTAQLTHLKSIPAANIRYDDKIFVRMDPVNAPDGTLNYIHIDSVQNGSSGYKATGKCFSITVSTRAWKVFDLEFGGSGSGTGNGIETVKEIYVYPADTAEYSPDTGISAYYNDATIKYRDSTTGATKSQKCFFNIDLPIFSGKYISIKANADDDQVIIEVDDTALALDYFKINKTVDSAVPLYQNGKTEPIRATVPAQINTLARRDANGDSNFRNVGINAVQASDGSYKTSLAQLYFSCADIYFTVAKTSTDTGTIGPIDFTRIQTYPNIRIIYNNQVYILQDPNTAPNGTLNYIHIDSIQDSSGNYKAIVKCFSITVSTRAWQMVSLNLARSYTHQICISNPTTNAKYYFTLVNNKSASYQGNAEGLISALSDTDTEFQPATRYKNGVVAALLHRSTQGYLVAEYDTNIENMTANQIVVWDNVI